MAGFGDGDGAIAVFAGALAAGRGGAVADAVVDGAGLTAGEGLFNGAVCGCTLLFAGVATGVPAVGGVARAGPGACC